MNWLDKLERKLGRYAIKNLIVYIVTLNLAVYLLMLVDTRGILIGKLILIPELVTRGEVWRLVSFIFIPPQTSVIWILFTLYFYYMVGSNLEHEWGSFRFNIYYLIGMAGTIIAAFITGAGTTAVYLNLSLFLAFAAIYPNYEILLFLILPVKVKYLGWLNWALIVYTIITGDLPVKGAAIASVINYFLFFGRGIVTRSKTTRQVYHNRRRFQYEIPNDYTMHRCTICGKTEKTDPKAEFRYCMNCEGDYEYCMEHLDNHEHVKKGTQPQEEQQS